MTQRWRLNQPPNAAGYRIIQVLVSALALLIICAMLGKSLNGQTTDPDAITAKVAVDSLAGRLADQVAATKKQADLIVALQSQTSTLLAQNVALQAKLDAVKPDPVMAAKAAWVDSLDAQCDTCRTAYDAGLAGKSGKFKGILICCGPTTVPPTSPDTSIVYITPK